MQQHCLIPTPQEGLITFYTDCIVIWDYISVRSGCFWRLLAAAEAKGCKRSGILLKEKPRIVWKEHRHSPMPFQNAYIKGEGFRVRYLLFSLVCLLVLDSLIS